MGLSFLRVKRPNTFDLGLPYSNEVLPSPTGTLVHNAERVLLTKLHDVPNLDVIVQV